MTVTLSKAVSRLTACFINLKIVLGNALLCSQIGNYGRWYRIRH